MVRAMSEAFADRKRDIERWGKDLAIAETAQDAGLRLVLLPQPFRCLTGLGLQRASPGLWS